MRTRPPLQYTFIHCPNCRNELIGDARTILTSTEPVTYVCGRCTHISRWDWDLAPGAMPLLAGSKVRTAMGWTKKVRRADVQHRCPLPVLGVNDIEHHWIGSTWQCASCNSEYEISGWMTAGSSQDLTPIWIKITH